MVARAGRVRFSVVVLCLLACGLTACSTGGTPGADPDGGNTVGDGGPPDAGLDAATGGGFGAPCDDVTDCAPPGTCYKPTPGSPGTCTNLCTGDCPDGFECKTVPTGNGLEETICIPAVDTFCRTCQQNSDCGDSSDLCVQLSAGRFCTIDCRDDPTVCPVGFGCVTLTGVGDGNARQCMPVNGVCCVDQDGDLRGVGDGCAAGDCDETNKQIYDDAAEVCDGLDNDCVGGVDVKPVDCAGAACQLGAFGYFERPADVCTGAGGCEQQDAVQCGLYTCEGGGEQGDACATSCDGEIDLKCVPTAHCDASVCLMDLANGATCDEDSDCASSHCQNGFCCNSGDCCATATDCPTFGVNAPVCEDSATCQGDKGQVSCVASECQVMNGVPDDTACGPTTLANECGLYKPIFCTGAATQAPPQCPTTCASNADCDALAYCDPITDTCKPDLDDGQACPQGAESCASGHCQNGFCCASGDCCASETDCPAAYSDAPVCTTPTACQGTSNIAQCVDARCTKVTNVPDDSACTAGVKANDCGPYLPIFCDGGTSQGSPACPTSCASSTECDAGAYCNKVGACVPDEPNGQACSADGDCQSGHCQNGFCCDSGDCCADAGDCGAYAQAPVCDAQQSCQGHRVDGACTASSQCTSTTVDDDSACAGLQANDCGPYPPVACTTGMTQPPGQGGLCATSCAGDADCDASAHCDGGVCVPDQGPGGFCTLTSQCGTGLQCVDNVCCTSACTGQCAACDVPGHEGTCFPIPGGTDPDAECGAVGCDGFYAGWSGDQCFRKAPVSAAQASCNGAGACRTQAEECTLQVAAGTVQATCDDNCQDPNGNTCTGTTAGACSNVSQGNQTCGIGVCQVSVPVCVSGQDNTCTPSTGSASEAGKCNDLDDDCDGVVDNSSTFEDGREPNNGCGQLATLSEIPSDATGTTTGLTIYPLGDNDYFKVRLHESDSNCGCGAVAFDEDYKVVVKLSVPVGAGSYRVCADNGSCSDSNCFTVTAGQTGQTEFFVDGACGPFGTGQDDYDLYLHVKGQNGQAFECQPYTLAVTFDAGYCK